jgi:uncharacterized protein YndB with AHSA1/START domain
VSDDIMSTGSSTSVVDSGKPAKDFTASVTTDAAPETVFDALTTPAAFAHWWVPASGGGMPGEELVIHFGETRAIFRVKEAMPASRVCWEVLTCEIEHDWDGTEISFTLAPIPDGGTRIDFRHLGLTPQLGCFEMCQSGWTQALGGLLNYAEGSNTAGE